MGKIFDKGRSEDDKKERLFKRLKNIEDKNEEWSKVIKDKNEEQLQVIKDQG